MHILLNEDTRRGFLFFREGINYMSKRKLTFILLLSFCITLFLVYQKANETLIYVSASGGSDPPVQKERIFKQDAEEVSQTIDNDVARLLEEEQSKNIVQTHDISHEKLELIATIIKNGDGVPREDIMPLINLIISSSDKTKIEVNTSNKQPPPLLTLDPVSTSNELVKPLSIVIVGKDTRKKGSSLNTDVIMVVVLNPKDKKMTMVSIPRDTKVKIPGYDRFYKVNSAYARGEIARIKEKNAKKNITVTGPDLLKTTLRDLLGIPIQHYALVDFEGFQRIIDQLNGIDVQVDKRMIYTDPTDGTNINLQPGANHLNGKQALDFVRHRHDDRGLKYFSSDMERNTRQQEVVKAVMNKMNGFSGAANLFPILEIIGQSVQTDIPKDVLQQLALTYIGTSPSNMAILPSNAYWDRKQSFTIIPDESLDALKTTLQRDFVHVKVQ